ncbi:MAG: AI-2E family transporter, partial [Clostridia bacterium]|nr:AI-2E family transporter [Clostridia bacterium]
YLALGLVLLYLIITAVRQFVEPKIVGDQLGLPPVVSIVCIYLGYIWFGILGVILIPVTVNILLCLQRAGKIHIWK